MQIKTFLGLLILIIILSSFITYLLYKGVYKESETIEIDMDLIVTSRTKAYGVNIDTDAVYFGMLPAGAAATKHLNITNEDNYKVMVCITKDNSTLSGIVSVPASFILKPYESKIVNIGVSVPEGFNAGNYTGKISVIIKEPFLRLIIADGAIFRDFRSL